MPCVCLCWFSHCLSISNSMTFKVIMWFNDYLLLFFLNLLIACRIIWFMLEQATRKNDIVLVFYYGVAEPRNVTFCCLRNATGEVISDNAYVVFCVVWLTLRAYINCYAAFTLPAGIPQSDYSKGSITQQRRPAGSVDAIRPLCDCVCDSNTNIFYWNRRQTCLISINFVRTLRTCKSSIVACSWKNNWPIGTLRHVGIHLIATTISGCPSTILYCGRQAAGVLYVVSHGISAGCPVSMPSLSSCWRPCH